MGENICRGSTRFYIRSTSFQYLINDIFLFPQKFDQANYADKITIYGSDKRVSTIMDSLSHEYTILSKWFYNNFMVLNPDKC